MMSDACMKILISQFSCRNLYYSCPLWHCGVFLHPVQLHILTVDGSHQADEMVVVRPVQSIAHKTKYVVGEHNPES